jgi:hypothetical protein
MRIWENSRLRRLGATLLVSGVTSVVLAAGSASAAVNTARTGSVVNRHAAPIAAAAVIANGVYQVQNVNSGKCLSLSQPGNNAPVTQFTCGAGTDTLDSWTLENVGGNNYEMVSYAYGLCLAIGANNDSNGTGAIDWTCAGIPDQIWIAVPVGGSYEFVNENSGLCLAIGANNTSNGAGAIQWTCAGIADQLWNVI